MSIAELGVCLSIAELGVCLSIAELVVCLSIAELGICLSAYCEVRYLSVYCGVGYLSVYCGVGYLSPLGVHISAQCSTNSRTCWGREATLALNTKAINGQARKAIAYQENTACPPLADNIEETAISAVTVTIG